VLWNSELVNMSHGVGTGVLDTLVWWVFGGGDCVYSPCRRGSE